MNKFKKFLCIRKNILKLWLILAMIYPLYRCFYNYSFVLNMLAIFFIILYLIIDHFTTNIEQKSEMKCFFVYVDNMWICCSESEEIFENTNTIKEGFNGDWYYNVLYKFTSRTGDITNFDFKIIAVGCDDNIKLPIIPEKTLFELGEMNIYNIVKMNYIRVEDMIMIIPTDLNKNN